jgi:hypothetical protein
MPIPIDLKTEEDLNDEVIQVDATSTCNEVSVKHRLEVKNQMPVPIINVWDVFSLSRIENPFYFVCFQILLY